MSDVGQISDFRTLLSTLSPDALTRGKQFERVTKWWLENDPIHSRQIEKVWLWDEWPEYPGRDIGIDLVARLLDGSLMAVQAKCVDESRSIPKSELDSFVSAASSSTFKHKMLVATTDGLSANAQRMLADQHVVRIMLSDLETSVDVWPNSIDYLDQHPVQPKATPRPHQQQAISDVTTGMSDHDRGQLIMACGTGKTLTALWITEQLKPAVTLVLVPSLNLLSQTLSEWSKNTTTDWSYLCVCSDDTVNKSDDQPISTVDELPFEVTTNPDDIANFLKHDGARIIFSTYQSSAQVAQAQQLTGTKFNLVICDEAHRLTGKTDADYATVLDNSKIVADKRLFMTATPRTYTPAAKSKAEDRGVEITSMDDETVYGPVLHKLSFGEAIKQDLLSDYRVLIVGVTDPQVQDLIDRRELVSVNDTVTTDARTLAAHIGLAKATKDYNLKRTISFHSRIKSADQFAQDHIKILDWLPDTHRPEGTTWTGTISGAMNTGERRRLITQLKQDDQERHALLTNARCLTEGVDVPSLDGVAFIDPRSSQVDIIQAVGRAIRKSANKEIGTIVLPVLIPTDADTQHALEDTAFKPIWAILNALKSHDEELAVELNTLRTELGRSGTMGELSNRLVEDLPADIDSILPGFSQKFSIAILEHSTSSWEMWFGLLQAFEEANEHCLVPKGFLFNNFKLGNWVSSQRSKYNISQLEEEKIQRLQSLKGWSWKPFEDQWNLQFQSLTDFAEINGHCTIPSRTEEFRSLAIWASHQRSQFRDGFLTDSQVSSLESIESWQWSPGSDGFAELERFNLQFGHTNVPSDYTFDDFDLGRWCTRKRYEFQIGQLTQQDIVRLTQFSGWSWDPENDEWERKIALLRDFAEKNGQANPPKGFTVDEVDLYKFAKHLRNRFGTLSDVRRTQVASIPGWSNDVFDFQFQRSLEVLIDYLEKASGVMPSTTTIYEYKNKEYKLGAWVVGRRQAYRKGKLDTQYIERLEAINGWSWNSKEDSREEMFEALKLFISREGHANVPAKHSENCNGKEVPLGNWVTQRRMRRRKSQLEQQEVDRLNAISEWTWEPLADKFEIGFSLLVDFVRKNGSAHVPTAHVVQTDDGQLFKLGSWCSVKRQDYIRGLLSQEKKNRLELLKGWTWDPKDAEWMRFYSAVLKFAKENGSAPKRGFIDSDGSKIGSWCDSTRAYFKKGILRKDRIALMEEIPNWSWTPHDESWESMKDLLIAYLFEEGSNIPAHLEFKGRQLGAWVGKQRAAYKQGRMEKTRISILEKIDGWSWERELVLSTGVRSDALLLANDVQSIPGAHNWFDVLANFFDKEGHTDVPITYEIDGKRLGLWVQKTRARYREKTLPTEIIDRLESTSGWRWDVREGRWEDQFKQLQDFANDHGHTSLSREDDNQKQLAAWVVTQRVRYHKGTLSDEQICDLETIPSWSWAPVQKSWESSFQYLLTYINRVGNANVPQDHLEGEFRLGLWVNKRRSAFKRGAMGDAERVQLEQLPGWLWSPTDARKERGFKLLAKFVDREGHAFVPAKHFEQDFPLGQWVSSRRQTYKRGKMPVAEQHRLENIAGWTWSNRE